MCGEIDSSSSESFVGEIDEFALWTIALTAADVSPIARFSICPDDPSLALYYRFDEWISTSQATATSNRYALASFGNSIVGSQSPKQVVSGAPVDDLIRVSLTDTAVFQLNASSGPSAQRIEEFLVVELPTCGMLQVAGTNKDVHEMPLRLNSHDLLTFRAWPTVRPPIQCFLTYTTPSNEDKTDFIVGTVLLNILASDSIPELSFDSGNAQLALQGMAVSDPDAWEEDNALHLRIQATNSDKNETIVISDTSGLSVTQESSPNASVDLVGTPENLNRAISSLGLRYSIVQSQQIDLTLSDLGNSGEGGVEVVHQSLALGAAFHQIPIVIRTSPEELWLKGTAELVVYGSQFMRNCSCVFDIGPGENVISVAAKFVSSTQLQCANASIGLDDSEMEGWVGKSVHMTVVAHSNAVEDQHSNVVVLQVRPPVNLLRITPERIQVKSEGVIYVQAAQGTFKRLDKLKCALGPYACTADFVSDSSITCYCQGLQRTGNYSVDIIRNGLKHSSSKLTLEVAKPSFALAVYPNRGLAQSETNVIVVGSGFQNASDLTCMFSNMLTTTAAVFLSSRQVACTVPRAPKDIALTTVSVSNGELDAGLSKAAFRYVAPPKVVQLYPNAVPITGGVRLRLLFDNYLDETENMACRFDFNGSSVTVDLERWLEREAVCITPPTITPQQAWVDVTVEGISRGDDSRKMLSFVRPITVKHVRPESILQSRGGVLTVMTDESDSNAPLYCTIFGDNGRIRMTVFMAIRISPIVLECHVPAELASEAPSHLQLCLSVEDQTRLNDDQCWPFEYAGNVTLKTVSPLHGSVRGGTEVHLTGGNLTNDIFCRFGDFIVQGKQSGKSTATCRSPSSSVGRVPLAISTDGGQNFEPSGFSFDYFPSLQVLAASPVSTGKDVYVRLELEDPVLLDAVEDLGVFCGVQRNSEVAFVRGQIEQNKEVTCVLAEVEATDLIAISLLYDYGAIDELVQTVAVPVIQTPTIQDVLPSHISSCEDVDILVSGANISTLIEWTCCLGTSCEVAQRHAIQTLRCRFPAVDGKPGTTLTFTLHGGGSTAHTSNIEVWDGPASVVDVLPSYTSASKASQIELRLNMTDRVKELIGQEPLGCMVEELEDIVPGLLNGNRLICMLPALRTIGSRRVVAVWGGQRHKLESAAQLQVVNPPRLLSLAPTTTLGAVNQMVLLRGDGFVAKTEMECAVTTNGTVRYFNATMLSTTTAQCTINSPPLSSTHVASVSVTIDRMEFSSMLSMTFVYPSKDSRLSPTAGSVNGGSTLLIQSVAVSNTLPVACEFAKNGTVSTVLGEVVLGDNVLCTVPEAASPGRAIVRVKQAESSLTIALAYTYVGEIEVARMEPSVGPISGGTTVDIYLVSPLDDNIPDDAIFVMFGEVVVNASRSGEDQLVCVSPPALHMLHETKVPVFVSVTSGLQFGRVDADFVYHGYVQLLDVNPRIGPAVGNTKVLVSATNIVPGSSVCVFTSKKRSEQWFVWPVQSGAGFIECITPSVTNVSFPEHIVLTVSTDSGSITYSDAIRFQLMPDIVVKAISPSFGSELGGTRVVLEIEENSFTKTTRPFCHVGNAMFPSEYVEPAGLACVLPPNAPGEVNISISFDGQQSSSGEVRFHFLPMPVLSAIYPSEGARGEATSVVLSGAGFKAWAGHTKLACAFGQSLSLANVVSDTHLECSAPPSHEFDQQVAVELSAKNQLITGSSGIFFTLLQAATVFDISPRRGPAVGGNSVTVYGTNFGDNLECRLGELAVRAQTVSDSELICAVPRGMYDPGIVAFRLVNRQTNRTVDTMSSTIVYEWVNVPKIAKLSPSAVVEEGQTAISVTGSGFLRSRRLTCIVGNSRVTVAEWISKSLIVCQIGDLFNVGNVTLQVSNDGETFSRASTLQVFPLAHITSVTPALGPEYGGTAVTILGSGFVDSSYLACIFGRQTVPAQFVNDSAVKCFTPAAVRKQSISSIELAVTNSYLTVSRKQIPTQTFKFYRRVEITSVNPSIGPSHGGTTVAIDGNSFDLNTTQCVFGNAVYVPYHLSEARVTCTVPPSKTGTYRIGLTRNAGSDVSYFPELFQVHEPIVVEDISPKVVSTRGGWQVFVSLQESLRTPGVPYCGFTGTNGTSLSEALALGDALYVCTTPGLESGDMRLSLTLNGRDLSNSQILSVIPSVFLKDLEPKSGSALGGFNLSLTGSGFTEAAKCLIGGVESQALNVSTDVIQCVVPSFNYVGHVPVRILQGGDISEMLPLQLERESSKITVYPMNGPVFGGTEIRLFGDNASFTSLTRCLFIDTTTSRLLSAVPVYTVDDGRWACKTLSLGVAGPIQTIMRLTHVYGKNHIDIGEFRFFGDLQVVAVHPLAVPENGGSLIRVRATGDILPSMLRCQFGGFISRGTMVMNDTFDCILPEGNYKTDIEMQISNDGHTYRPSNYSLRVLPNIVITGSTPVEAAAGFQVTVNLTTQGTKKTDKLLCLCWHEGMNNVTSGLRVRTAIMLASSIACQLPLRLHAGTVRVAVAHAELWETSRQDVHRLQSISFTYYEKPRLVSVVPRLATAEHRTLHTLKMSSLHGVGNLALECIFKNSSMEIRTPGERVGGETVSCASPVLGAGHYRMHVEASPSWKSTSRTVPFVEEVRVFRLVPNTGSESGFTPITVRGKGFGELNGGVQCLFDNLAVNASVTSDTVIACTSPALQSGPVSFKLKSEVGLSFNSSVLFRVIGRVSLEGISAKAGPVRGGTSIRLTGTNFGSRTRCALNGRLGIVQELMADNSITCVSPQASWTDHTADVSVTNDLIHWTNTSHRFAYFIDRHILEVVPRVAFLNDTASERRLLLKLDSPFPAEVKLFCHFSTHGRTLAVQAGPAVFCSIPDASREQIVHVSVNAEDGTAVTGQAMPFEYIRKPTVLGFTPKLSQTNGNDRIKIRLSETLAGLPVLCKFGEVITDPGFTGGSRVDCISPPGLPRNVVLSLLLGNTTSLVVDPSFPVFPPVKPLGIVPEVGPIHGGSTVRFVLDEATHPYQRNEDALCSFGPRTVQAVRSSRSFLCAAPSAPDNKPGPVKVRLHAAGFDTEREFEFTYVKQPQVVAARPAFVSINSSVPITLTVLDTPSNPVCAFLIVNVTTAAMVSSANSVECESPNITLERGMPYRTVPVAVVASDELHRLDRAAPGSIPFTFTEPTHVTAISPALASVEGGTKVHVHGAGFYHSSEARCRFGTVETVPARFLSLTELVCKTPLGQSPGEVALAISANGVDYIQAPVRFEFYTPPIATSVFPSSGPINGGTSVVVMAEKLRNISSLGAAFVFNETTLELTNCNFINVSSMLCKSSPTATAGTATVAVSLNGVDATSRSNTTFLYYNPVEILDVQPRIAEVGSAVDFKVVSNDPLLHPSSCRLMSDVGEIIFGDVAQRFEQTWCVFDLSNAMIGHWYLGVSQNRQDWTAFKTPLMLTEPLSPVDFFPKSGPEDGKTRIIVTVTSAYASSSVRCKFGDVETAAVAVEASLIQCVTPQLVPGHRVEVAVSNGGDVFARVPGMYYVYPRMSVSGFVPEVGSASGGVSIVVSGNNVLTSRTMANYSCVLSRSGGGESVELQAVSVTDTKVRCGETRPLPAGEYLLSLLVNGNDKVTSTTHYQAYDPPILHGILPISGVVSADIVVIVFGEGLSNTTFCDFGGTRWPAQNVSDTQVTCRAPSPGQEGILPINLVKHDAVRSIIPVYFKVFRGAVVLGITPPYLPFKNYSAEEYVLVHVSSVITDTRSFCLWSNQFVTKLEVINATLVKCALPNDDQLTPGRQALDIVHSSTGVTHGGTGFVEVKRTIHMMSLSPTHGPITGATQLRIRLLQWFKYPAIDCVLVEAGGTWAKRSVAEVMNDEEVSCTLSHQVAAEMNVTVTLMSAGVVISDNSLSFHVSKEAYVEHIWPLLGPAAGSTSIEITGGNFHQITLPVLCEFDSRVQVRATVLSDTKIVCTTPRSEGFQRRVVNIRGGDGVEVSPNMNIVFTFLPAIQLTSLVPSSLPAQSQNKVVVFGEGFSEVAARFGLLTCRFEQIVKGKWLDLPAERIDDHHMSCLAPRLHPGQTALSISYNRQQFSRQLQLEIVHDQVVTDFTPRSLRASGGTPIYVHGYELPTNGSFVCTFSCSGIPTASVVGTWINHTLLHCMAPQFTPPIQTVRSCSLDIYSNHAKVRRDESFAEDLVVFGDFSARGLIPATGPVAGSTQITVEGDGVIDSSLISVSCEFEGIHTVPGTIQNNQQILCSTPMSPQPGQVPVRLIFGTDDIVDIGTFSYHAELSLESVSPGQLSQQGGTFMVVGTGFVEAPSLACKVGQHEITKAEWISASKIVCKAPPSTPGFSTVIVSNNGVDFNVSAGLQIYFTPLVIISGIFPSAGWSNQPVTLVGMNFPLDLSGFRCQFVFHDGYTIDRKIAAGNSTSAVCQAPSYRSGFTTTLVHLCSLNGSVVSHPSEPGISFTYEKQVAVTGMYPSSGPTEGGTVVSISGEGFFESGGIRCRFGDAVVPAHFVSFTQIQCATPYAELPQGVPVQIMVDDYSHRTPLTFSYMEPLVPLLPILQSRLLVLEDHEIGVQQVRLAATGFIAGLQLECKIGVFGKADGVVATYVNASTLLCNWPTLTIPSGRYEVMASLNGQNFVRLLTINIVDSPQRSQVDVFPIGGPSSDPILVHVSFELEEPLEINLRTGGCSFDELGSLQPFVTATRLNSTRVEVACLTAPTTMTGPVPLLLAYETTSNSGLSYFLASEFTFYVQPVLRASIPWQVGKEGGLITLLVDSLSDQSLGELLNQLVAVFTFNASTMVFVDPTSISVSNGHVRVQAPPLPIMQRSSKGADSFSCRIALRLGNGTEVSERGVTIFYRDGMEILDVSPIAVIEATPTTMLVHSRRLDRYSDLVCFFNLNSVVPSFRSRDRVVCEVPALSYGAVNLTLATASGQLMSQPQVIDVVQPVELQEISPFFGPLTGGTKIRLFGVKFETDLGLFCLFGDQNQRSAVLTDSSGAYCYTPPSQDLGQVRLSLAYERHTDLFRTEFTFLPINSNKTHRFQFIEGAIISNFQPKVGAIDESTTVYITGSGFYNSSYLLCSFNGIKVSATFVNASHVICTIPSTPNLVATNETAVTIAVSNNGQDFTQATTRFFRVPRPNITRMNPTAGPLSGGVIVHVHGTGFTTRSRCRFGLLPSVATTFWSDSLITCRTPAVSSENVHWLSVTNDGYRYVQGNDTRFTFSNAPMVYAIAPVAGPMRGGTSVEVNGTNLDKASFCWFGQLATGIAARVSSKTIRCVSPAGQDAHAVAFVLADASDSRTASHSFTYFIDPEIHSLSPKVSTVNGGTVLTVVGSGFAPSGVACVFNSNRSSAATTLSSEMLSCTVPSQLKPGVATLDIANNGIDYAAGNGGRFEVFRTPRITQIEPTRGPVQGGNLVRVSGDGLKATPHTLCSFGMKDVPILKTAAVDQSYVECVAPSNLEQDEVQRVRIGACRNDSFRDVFRLRAAGGFNAGEVHHVKLRSYARTRAKQRLHVSQIGQPDVERLFSGWVDAINEVQQLTLLHSYGNVSLQNSSRIIDVNASSVEVREYIESIQPVLGFTNVVVESNTSAVTWTITFYNDLQQPTLLAVQRNISGTARSVPASVVQQRNRLGGWFRFVRIDNGISIGQVTVGVTATSEEYRAAFESLLNTTGVIIQKEGPDEFGAVAMSILQKAGPTSSYSEVVVDTSLLTGIGVNASLRFADSVYLPEVQTIFVTNQRRPYSYRLWIDLHAALPEIQTIETTPNESIDGNFTLRFGTTLQEVAIQYNASTSQVKEAIEGVLGSGLMNVTRQEWVGFDRVTWTVTFDHALGDVAQVEAFSESLNVSVATIQDGVTTEVQEIELVKEKHDSAPSAFICSLDDMNADTAVTSNTSASALEFMLASIEDVGVVRVERSERKDLTRTYFAWTVTFTERLGKVNLLNCSIVSGTVESLKVKRIRHGVGDYLSRYMSTSFQLGADGILSRSLGFNASAEEIMLALHNDLSFSDNVTASVDTQSLPKGISSWLISTDVPFQNLSIDLRATSAAASAAVELIEVGSGTEAVGQLSGKFAASTQTRTVEIPVQASAGEMEIAIERLRLGHVYVSRETITGGHRWDITFHGYCGSPPELQLIDTTLTSQNGRPVVEWNRTLPSEERNCSIGGSFRLRAGPMNHQLNCSIAVLNGLPSIRSTCDLRSVLARGDALRIGQGVYTVSQVGAFSENMVPLNRPYAGATNASELLFVREWTEDLSYDIKMADLQLQLEQFYPASKFILTPYDGRLADVRAWEISFDSDLGEVPAMLVESAIENGRASVAVDEDGSVLEVQEIRVDSSFPATGTFRVGFEGAYTQSLPADVSEDGLAAALKELDTVGDIVVTRQDHLLDDSNLLWHVTFLENAGNLELLKLDLAQASSVNGGRLRGSVSRVVKGSSAQISGGCFDLDVDDRKFCFDYDAPAEVIEDVLLDVGSVNVSRTEGLNGGMDWFITFTYPVGRIRTNADRISGTNVSIESYLLQESVPASWNFTLASGGQETVAINPLFNASGIADILEDLDLVHFANVTEVRRNDDFVDFEIQLDLGNLTGVAVALYVFRQPTSGHVSLVRVSRRGIPVTGSFALQFGNQITLSDLTLDSSGEDVQRALEDLHGVGKVIVSKLKRPDTVDWLITFKTNGVPMNIGRQPLLAIARDNTFGSCVLRQVERILEPCCNLSISLDGQTYSDSQVHYRYSPSTFVSAVAPLVGPIAGGTSLVLHGAGFVDMYGLDDPLVLCVFEGVDWGPCTSEGTALNSTTVTCTSPDLRTCAKGVSTTRAVQALLRVQTLDSRENVFHDSLTSTVFTFHPRLAVTEVDPLRGSYTGGTELVLELNRDPILPCTCCFGTREAAAVDRGNASISCITPALSGAGPVAFYVKDAVDRTDSTVFWYTNPPKLIQMLPAVAPVYGQTMIRIQSPGHGEALLCDFFGEQTAAVYENDEFVRCLTPALDGAVEAVSGVEFHVGADYVDATVGNYSFQLHLNASSTEIASALREASGRYSSSWQVQKERGENGWRVLVVSTAGEEIRLNGSNASATYFNPRTYSRPLRMSYNLQEHSSWTMIYYTEPVIVERIVPAGGPSLGGTKVELHVSEDLPDFEDMQPMCSFGLQEAHAEIVSTRLVRCTSPKLHSTSNGTVSVGLSLALESTNVMGSLPFTLEDLPRLLTLDPRSGLEDLSTSVLLTGTNFLSSEGNPKCVISSDEEVELFVEVQLVNDTNAICVVPPMARLQSRFVAVSFFTGSFTTAPLAFVYIEPFRVDNVYPNFGPAAGGTRVMLHGGPFTSHPGSTRSAQCRFGPPSLLPLRLLARRL